MDTLCSLGGKLSQSIDRVRSLELEHAQHRLDWEGRVSEAQRLCYSKHQETHKNLTESRDRVSVCMPHVNPPFYLY